jgi:hypothetical protein
MCEIILPATRPTVRAQSRQVLYLWHERAVNRSINQRANFDAARRHRGGRWRAAPSAHANSAAG